jgi:MFS transporter, DHA2 family, multidrug resistance protein
VAPSSSHSSALCLLAQQYPQYSNEIAAAARSSFLSGADWAYTAGIVAILIGAVIVFVLFPGKESEERLLAAYQTEDTGR